MLDFEQRCAYSMQHVYRAGGKKCMEVDHFNPRKKQDRIQDYANLYPSTRHCNGAKRNRWPSIKDQKVGLRFLDCCAETDYGIHIFEDPDTHELVGVTASGRYHIRYCDLNAEHLVEERAERTRLWNLLENRTVKIKSGVWELPPEFQAIRDVAILMIPKVPFLSGALLAAKRAKRAASVTVVTV